MVRKVFSNLKNILRLCSLYLSHLEFVSGEIISLRVCVFNFRKFKRCFHQPHDWINCDTWVFEGSIFVLNKMNIVITREKVPSVPLQVSLSFLYASLQRTTDLFSATMGSSACSKTLYRKKQYRIYSYLHDFCCLLKIFHNLLKIMHNCPNYAFQQICIFNCGVAFQRLNNSTVP